MNRFESKTQRSPGSTVRLAALCACLLLFGASCGQRGPLYLPQSDSASDGAADMPAQTDEGAESDTDEASPAGDDGEKDEASP